MKIDELMQRRVETALLDCDGSCRDINFAEEISTSAAIDVLEVLASFWTLAQATTEQGVDLAAPELKSKLQKGAGSLSTIWNGGSNPENIQAYFFWDKADRVFCEITFFPRDFDSETFELMDFLSMLRKLVVAARCEEYYLRYEDASWRHGQQQQAGIILCYQVLSLSAA